MEVGQVGMESEGRPSLLALTPGLGSATELRALVRILSVSTNVERLFPRQDRLLGESSACVVIVAT